MQGRVGSLPVALEMLATAEAWSGQYAAAAADATEGLRILRDTGQAASGPDFLAFLALHAAVQGREDECRAHAGEALERATALGLGLPAAEASHALALLDLGLGRPAEAFERLHALAGAAPGAGHPRLAHLYVADLVEAAVLAGRADAAEAALSAFERWIEHSGAPPMLALLARCRGQLAAGEAAARHFAEALRLHAGHDRPFERARTELLYGEALRRARRRLEARAHLRAALETFERLGAVPWKSARAASSARAVRRPQAGSQHGRRAHAAGAPDTRASSARARRTGRSPRSSSSARGRSTTTCARSSGSSRSRRGRS